MQWSSGSLFRPLLVQRFRGRDNIVVARDLDHGVECMAGAVMARDLGEVGAYESDRGCGVGREERLNVSGRRREDVEWRHCGWLSEYVTVLRCE